MTTSFAAMRPLQAVLAAVSSGVTTRAELRRRLDFPDDVIDAALDHLIRTGRVGASPLALGCAIADCGGCPLAFRKGCRSRSIAAGLERHLPIGRQLPGA